MLQCAEMHFNGGKQSAKPIVQVFGYPGPFCFLAIDHRLQGYYLLLAFKKFDLILLEDPVFFCYDPFLPA